MFCYWLVSVGLNFVGWSLLGPSIGYARREIWENSQQKSWKIVWEGWREAVELLAWIIFLGALGYCFSLGCSWSSISLLLWVFCLASCLTFSMISQPGRNVFKSFILKDISSSLIQAIFPVTSFLSVSSKKVLGMCSWCNKCYILLLWGFTLLSS